MSNLIIKKQIDKGTIKQKDSLLHALYTLYKESDNPNHHLEDIAIKNKKLFPYYFGWSKHSDQIDLRQVMRTLIDLKNEGFLVGSNKTTWSLTTKGLKLCEWYWDANEDIQINTVSTQLTSHQKTRAGSFYKRELQRILHSDCFIKFSAGKKDLISKNELKYLFRIDHYNKEESFERNKERLYAASINNEKVNIFLDQMIEMLQKEKIIELSLNKRIKE